MRQKVVISSLLDRVSQRTNLVLIALVGGLFGIFRIVFRAPGPLPLTDILLPFGMLFIHLALAPMPWQWTGDGAPRASMLRGFLQSLLFNALWVAAALGVLFLLFEGAEGFKPPPPPPEFGAQPPPRPHPSLFGLGFGLLNVAFGIVFGWVFAEKEATELRERATADLLRQSKAQALQNQLDPHVLYNALSSLSELVYEDPLAAEEVITRLADLYRMLTLHGKADRIPLRQERLLVEAYLSMEQMRLGERLAAQWDWPAEADDLLAPPLFLQPLVENAIKHGISPSASGGQVTIRCQRIGSSAALVVENTGKPLVKDAPRGVGLGNLEARLALWTEVRGTFSLTSEGGRTIAKVQWESGGQA